MGSRELRILSGYRASSVNEARFSFFVRGFGSVSGRGGFLVCVKRFLLVSLFFMRGFVLCPLLSFMFQGSPLFGRRECGGRKPHKNETVLGGRVCWAVVLGGGEIGMT